MNEINEGMNYTLYCVTADFINVILYKMVAVHATVFEKGSKLSPKRHYKFSGQFAAFPGRI